MLGKMAGWFGTARVDARAAVAAFLEDIDFPGEVIARDHLIRDFNTVRIKRGWPRLSDDVLLREIEQLGAKPIDGYRLPEPREPSPQLTATTTEPPWPPLPPAPSSAHPSSAEPLSQQPSPRRRSYVERDDALVDLLQRLERGEAVPSQQSLADAWGVHKGAVSKWFKGWERAGLLSARSRTRDGRCNIIQMPVTPREVRAA